MPLNCQSLFWVNSLFTIENNFSLILLRPIWKSFPSSFCFRKFLNNNNNNIDPHLYSWLSWRWTRPSRTSLNFKPLSKYTVKLFPHHGHPSQSYFDILLNLFQSSPRAVLDLDVWGYLSYCHLVLSSFNSKVFQFVFSINIGNIIL